MSPGLASLCELVIDCEHRTAPEAPDGAYPLIRTPDIGVGVLKIGRAQRVAEDTYREWTKRAVPRAGDLILAREAPVGNVGIVLPGVSPVLGQRTVLIRPRRNVLDPYYLNYLLSGPDLRGWMDGVSTGATVPHLNMADIRSMELPPLPPLQIQRKIAAVLSAYDELSENNNRRIKLLEEMARRIYREWFVDFGYPGHENVRWVDSALGPIPEGWSIAQVGDHAKVIRGRSYRGVDLVDDGGMPFINLKCVARDGGFRADGVKRYVGDFRSSHKVVTGDLVMAVTDMTQERRIVARAARVPDLGEDFGVMSMDLVKLAPTDLPREFLLGCVSYTDFADEVKGHANGANVLHLHPDRISEYVSVFPTFNLAQQYAALVKPLHRLGDVLQSANAQLSASRDLLIPRLTSGEIDVENLAIAIPDAAA